MNCFVNLKDEKVPWNCFECAGDHGAAPRRRVNTSSSIQLQNHPIEFSQIRKSCQTSVTLSTMCKSFCNFTKLAALSLAFCYKGGFGAVQTCVHIVDLQTCYTRTKVTWLQNAASLQPETSIQNLASFWRRTPGDRVGLERGDVSSGEQKMHVNTKNNAK